jgi:hypothetical protein
VAWGEIRNRPRNDSRLGAQIRWKTSLPRVRVTRPFGPTMVAVNLVATVVGPTKRPDQTAFTLQSEVHVREV